jgi:hypothetical protein
MIGEAQKHKDKSEAGTEELEEEHEQKGKT